MLSRALTKSRLRTTPAATRAFSGETVRVTALNKYHQERLGGKMVPFAGYEMPVQYAGEKGGVMKEHLHCRSDCGVFDVSHMG